MSEFLKNLIGRHNSKRAVVKPRLLGKFESRSSAEPQMFTEIEHEKQILRVPAVRTKSDESKNNDNLGRLKAKTPHQNPTTQLQFSKEYKEEQKFRSNDNHGELATEHSIPLTEGIKSDSDRTQDKFVIPELITESPEQLNNGKKPILQNIQTIDGFNITNHINKISNPEMLGHAPKYIRSMIVNSEESAPTIKVTIGKIEVNAKSEPPKKQRQKRNAQKPNITLQDYMEKRIT